MEAKLGDGRSQIFESIQLQESDCKVSRRYFYVKRIIRRYGDCSKYDEDLVRWRNVPAVSVEPPAWTIQL